MKEMVSTGDKNSLKKKKKIKEKEKEIKKSYKALKIFSTEMK